MPPLLTKWKHHPMRLLIISLALAFLAGCSSWGFPGVYRINVEQGNIITQDMVDQLRPGMTKRQVIFVMGTPLVRDPFHQDRWDYVYNYQPGGGTRGQERLSVFFANDQLINFTGDFVPSTCLRKMPAASHKALKHLFLAIISLFV